MQSKAGGLAALTTDLSSMKAMIVMALVNAKARQDGHQSSLGRKVVMGGL